MTTLEHTERPLLLEDLRRYWDPLPDNIASLLREIKEEDRVLDVGGWWKPFKRADSVVDWKPYDTRGGGGSIGTGLEQFSRDTWFQMDVCSSPLPFPDKCFDFVVCSQTLEDLKDPVRVCKELVRVGKRGYIETPSIWIECQFGIDAPDESPGYPGYQQHRWLVDYKDSSLVFLPKLAYLATLCFVDIQTVRTYIRDQRIWTSGLFWEGEFVAKEFSTVDLQTVAAYLKKYFADFNYTPFQPTAFV